MSQPVLGSLTLNLLESYSGFAYPSRTMTVQLLAPSPTAVGNAVVQSSSLMDRVATVSWLAPSTADRDTAVGYFRDLSQQTFTDLDGADYTVIVSELTTDMASGGYWTCTATLIEVTPMIEGS